MQMRIGVVGFGAGIPKTNLGLGFLNMGKLYFRHSLVDKNIVRLQVNDLISIGVKMSTDTTPSKPKIIYKVINVILLIYSASIALVVFSTYSFESLQSFKKVVLIVPALFLTAFMIIKEFKVQSLVRRVYFNLFIFIGFILIAFCLYSIW